MTEFEVYDLAVQFLGFAHELGEATHSRLEFWSGVSYGLIAMAYIAPQRLSLGVASYLLVLYMLFSLNSIQNIRFDIDTAAASRHDALQLMEKHNFKIEAVVVKNRPDIDNEFALTRVLTSLYAPGLFLGTVGFITITCYRRRRIREH